MTKVYVYAIPVCLFSQLTTDMTTDNGTHKEPILVKSLPYLRTPDKSYLPVVRIIHFKDNFSYFSMKTYDGWMTCDFTSFLIVFQS